jgi:predicted ATPase
LDVCKLLRGDETHLLTLTGPGGTGMTRLALQVAADLLDDFPDGTYFTQLATLTEGELFLSTVAETLGVKGEQVFFARLAVFSGGRTLEAVDAICDAEGDLPVDPFDGFSSLVDKSLLRQEEGPGGEPRFVMLETVHEFAREKLQESAEAGEIKRTHAQYSSPWPRRPTTAQRGKPA